MIVQACRKGVRICTEDHRADAAVAESANELEEMLLASSVAYRVRNEQYRSTLRTPDALTWHTLPRHSSTEVDDSAVREMCNSCIEMCPELLHVFWVLTRWKITSNPALGGAKAEDRDFHDP